VAIDREKLAKIMGMTTSDKEGEVLAAIALANAMLVREGTNWTNVLEGPVRVPKISITMYERPKEEGDWLAPHLKDKVMIDTMFRAIYTQPRQGNEDFWREIDTMHNNFMKHGVVTQPQYIKLKKVYQRITTAGQR
jgi:hypothetical protein